jgi:single-strand DNA-binding protein
MASYNKIILVGNVGRDPELRQTPTSKVVDFSIAVNEPARGQQPEKTEWYRITFWDRRAETIAQYVRKGSPIMVEGRLSVRTYLDSSQRERYSLEVSGTDFVLLGARDQAEGQHGHPGHMAQPPASAVQAAAPSAAPPVSAPALASTAGSPPSFDQPGGEDALPF